MGEAVWAVFASPWENSGSRRHWLRALELCAAYRQKKP